MLRAAALAALARAAASDATVGVARHAGGGRAPISGAARHDWSAGGGDPGPAPADASTTSTSSSAAASFTPPPDEDPVFSFLRRLGVSKSLTRRSLADRAGLLDLVSAGLRGARSHLATSLTKKAIETDFDGPTFLEGAVGAYKAVHAAAAAQDWAALAQMTTPAITEAAQRLTAAAAAEGLAVSLEVEDSVHAEIDTMFLMSSRLVDRTAAGWTEENEENEESEEGGQQDEAGSASSSSDSSVGPTPSTPWTPELVGKHQGLYVRFSGGAVTLRLAAGRGAAAAAAVAGLAAPPADTGGTVLEVVDRRARTWIFERGPLPPGLPVRDTQLAWRVLAIDPS